MKTAFKRFIFILLTLSQSNANAGWITPFSTVEEKRRVFSITSDDTEDTRIDYNQDKKIDYWKIRKGPLHIEAYYGQKRIVYHVRKFERNFVHDLVVTQDGKNLKLISTSIRKQIVFNYTSNEIECTSQRLKSLSSILDDLQKTTIDTQACIQNFTSDKCYSREMNQSFVNEISDAVGNVFRIPDNSPNEINKGLACFKDSRVKSFFTTRFGDKDGEVEYEKALIGLKNSIINFSRMQDTKKSDGAKAVIQCIQTSESNPKPPMKTSEGGQIQILVKKEGEIYSAAEIEQQLFHENLHSSSVTDESLAQAITELCYKNKVTALKPRETPQYFEAKSTERIPTTIDGVAQGNIAQSEKTPVAIPASVEVPLPPPSNSSPIDMNRVAAIESTERVQSISNSQSRGIVRMAESVLAATPAVAAPSTTGLASATSGSTSSRLPASTYKASTSAPAAKLLAKQNSNGLKPGEYIKEEIDLTQQSAPTRPRVAANASEKPTVAASAKNGLSEPATTEVSANSDIASSGSLAIPAGRSNDTMLSISSSTGARSPRRGMASSGSAVSQVDFAKSKTGLVTQLSATSNYQKIRAQLGSTEFVQNLKDNSITVYNLQGKTWGAKKGDIIFLDQGDRFVREK